MHRHDICPCTFGPAFLRSVPHVFFSRVGSELNDLGSTGLNVFAIGRLTWRPMFTLFLFYSMFLLLTSVFLYLLLCCWPVLLMHY